MLLIIIFANPGIKETLKGLFDYNSFSPSTKLEQMINESVTRTENLSAPDDSEKESPFISFENLEQLSAAGKGEPGELPPSLNNGR